MKSMLAKYSTQRRSLEDVGQSWLWTEVQTIIRLLPEEQPALGLHRRPFQMNIIDRFVWEEKNTLNFIAVPVIHIIYRK